MKEIWKDIKGYEGIYQVSNFGRIKSLSRNVYVNGHKRTLTTKIIKLSEDKGGYLYCCLHKEKIKKVVKVHRVVCQEFNRTPNGKEEVNHIDGNKKNNTPKNLEWCTRSYNMKHAFKNGLKNAKGINNTRSLLTEKEVREIRRVYKKGLGSELASKYNVSNPCILDVVNNRTWTHLL